MKGSNQKNNNSLLNKGNILKVEIEKRNNKHFQLNRLYYVLLGLVLLITFWCYHYSLSNKFTNWDDNRFISDNIFIRSFSPSNLKMMLFHDITGDYYNPVTMISYAINYHFSALSPQAYYRTNIIIHLFNSCLVFILVLVILEAMEKQDYGIFKGKEWMAFFCTLAFAIHPIHVESVSWIAERKDVLYAFFYFAGIITYIKFVQKSKERRMKSEESIVKSFSNIGYYLLVLGFYFLSLLSKPMAIVFPFSLVMIDVLLKRDKTMSLKKIGFEKLPFLLIMLISLITTYYAEKSSGAALQHQFSFFQRILFASYSFFMYVVKAIIPIPLSSYYPYPETSGESGYLPVIFYLSPLISLLLAGIPLCFSYRAGENNFRVTLFGLGFYFFNMVMVSKIIDSGPYLLADRYTYVCYFGLYLATAYFACKILQESKPLVKSALLSVIFIYMLFLGVLCYQRTFIWHNSETLWTDVINKYPHRIVEAYNSLGNYYFAHRDIDRAYENYEEAINLKMEDPKVYCNMGILMRAKKQYNLALNYYTAALKLDSNDAIIYVNRANIFAVMRKYNLAISDYRHSLRINPYSEVLLANIAFTYLNAKQFDSAINYYTRVIQINSANPGYFHYRGAAEFEKGNIQPAIEDFMQNLQISPHDSECMYDLSVLYNHINDYNIAYKYAQMAQNAQYSVPPDYMQSLKARFDKN